MLMILQDQGKAGMLAAFRCHLGDPQQFSCTPSPTVADGPAESSSVHAIGGIADVRSRLRNDCPMRNVKIGTGARYLLLTPLDPMDAPPQSLAAELHLDGLTASVVVVHHYASGFRDLDDFFEQQAQDWRGWEGVREWHSLEGDLRLEARHEYGHVQLRVTMRKTLADWGNDGWVATGDLTIDPGEQLTRVAADLKALAGG
jgi:hypothetical protein